MMSDQQKKFLKVLLEPINTNFEGSARQKSTNLWPEFFNDEQKILTHINFKKFSFLF